MSKIQIDFSAGMVSNQAESCAGPKPCAVDFGLGEDVHGGRQEIVVALGLERLAVARDVEHEHIVRLHAGRQLLESRPDFPGRDLLVEQRLDDGRVAVIANARFLQGPGQCLRVVDGERQHVALIAVFVAPMAST